MTCLFHVPSSYPQNDWFRKENEWFGDIHCIHGYPYFRKPPIRALLLFWTCRVLWFFCVTLKSAFREAANKFQTDVALYPGLSPVPKKQPRAEGFIRMIWSNWWVIIRTTVTDIGKKYYVPLRIGNIGNWLSVKLFIGWQIHVNIPYSLGKSI